MEQKTKKATQQYNNMQPNKKIEKKNERLQTNNLGRLQSQSTIADGSDAGSDLDCRVAKQESALCTISFWQRKTSDAETFNNFAFIAARLCTEYRSMTHLIDQENYESTLILVFISTEINCQCRI